MILAADLHLMASQQVCQVPTPLKYPYILKGNPDPKIDIN